MMTYYELTALCRNIDPGPDLSLTVGEDGTHFFLQVFQTSNPTETHGRKWRISPFSCPSEIVQTALQAVITWHEHEARESFTYKGRAIFAPHFDVEALVELYDSGRFDART